MIDMLPGVNVYKQGESAGKSVKSVRPGEIKVCFGVMIGVSRVKWA